MSTSHWHYTIDIMALDNKHLIVNGKNVGTTYQLFQGDGPINVDMVESDNPKKGKFGMNVRIDPNGKRVGFINAQEIRMYKTVGGPVHRLPLCRGGYTSQPKKS